VKHTARKKPGIRRKPTVEDWLQRPVPVPTGLADRCPNCGSHDVAVIMYGYPAWDAGLEALLASRKIVLGGCIVSGDDATRSCNACSHRWRAVEHKADR
jgi:hypothetical protein